MAIYCHVGYQAHTQTKQSLQITLHKHALEFEHVRDYLLPRVNSRELNLA